MRGKNRKDGLGTCDREGFATRHPADSADLTDTREGSPTQRPNIEAVQFACSVLFPPIDEVAHREQPVAILVKAHFGKTLLEGPEAPVHVPDHEVAPGAVPGDPFHSGSWYAHRSLSGSAGGRGAPEGLPLPRRAYTGLKIAFERVPSLEEVDRFVAGQA